MRWLLVIGCLTLFISGPAQTSRKLVRLPFEQLTGGVMMIHARLDNLPDTLNFILDSGSGGISLDSTTAHEFSYKPELTNHLIRGIAGIQQVRYINSRKLRLDSLQVDSLNFHVVDYGILDAVYGIHIDGIIGYSVFSRFVLHINYDSSFVEFWSRGKVVYPKGGELFRPFLTTLPVQPGIVRDQNERNVRFLYDLGAGLSLLLTERFIRDSNLLMPKRKIYPKEAEGLGGKIDMNLTVVKKFKMGPFVFRNVPSYVFNDANNITSYPYLCGLIGSDLLRRFNSIINYEQREFHLTPNSHYLDPFDYAYSGIELYYVNGRIMLGDVAKDSPAEKAGLKEGDVVIGINDVFSQNMTQYKQALQTPNSRLKIIISRNGEIQQYTVRVGSIL